MSGAPYWRPTIACLLLLTVGAHPAAAKELVNLLRLPQAKLETTSLVGDQAAALAALTDGKPDTTANLPATASETIDLVFGFGGEIVAPEAIVVTASTLGGAVPPSHIEVLGSSVSSQSGFHSLRGDPIQGGTPSQKFSFVPVGVRWIMIRLTVAKADATALAEVELLGRQGLPATPYTFSETPARAIDILARLQAISAVKLEVTADEKAAFDNARAGRLDAASFADAALLASGVLDAARRKAYLARIDGLVAKAQSQVGTKGSPIERGDAILKWLHREALAKGYSTKQTDLSVLLDAQTFNCVSSAVIYNIVALRLGLDVRAIEVPDHAFSILYQGTTHVDVETTNPLGFNPARDPRKVEAFEKMTGFRYIPEAHRDERREVTEAGLAAIIYYNKGVELDKAKRHHDALLSYFRAMSLDQEFASAAKNALASLANWSLELSNEHKWQQALDVAAVGLTLAPKDALLANNQRAIWTRWAMALADAGQPDEAVATMKRAALVLPDAGFERMQAWIYIKPAEELAKAKNWRGALAAAESGLAKLDPGPRQELVKWRDQIALRWAGSEIDAGRFEAAAAVLAEAHSARPGDARLRDAVGYLAQEWAKKAGADGFATGIAVLASLDRQFAAVDTLKKAKAAFVWRHVKALVEAGRMEDSLASVEDATELLNDPDEKRRLIVFTFDTSAKRRAKAGAWSDAADLYARALKIYSADDLLKNNVVYLAQEWQKAAYAKGGATEVAAVQAILAAKFPGAAKLGDSGRDQIRRTVSEQVRSRDYTKALETLKSAGSLLVAADMTELNELIYDNWAKERIAAKDWGAAADIYATGLAAASSSSLLQSNVIYLAQEWQKAAYAKGGATEVAAVQAILAAKFPGAAKLGDSGRDQIRRTVSEQVRSRDYTKALDTLKSAGSLLVAADMMELNELIYDNWAKERIAAKDWGAAADIYATGLAATSSSSLLQSNVVYLAQEWARAAFAGGGVDAVLQVARQATAKFPDVPDVKAGPAGIIANAVQEGVKAAGFADAIAMVERAGEALGADRQRNLFEYSYDRWARTFIDKKQWDEAIRIYDQGLARLPNNSLFIRNRDYCLAQRK